jgi:hypothetical protein
VTTAEYMRAIELCGAAVDAHYSDDGGPTVAGGILGALRDLLDPAACEVCYARKLDRENRAKREGR